MKKAINVKFVFEVDETKSEEEIRKCIEYQIYTDLNCYYQNDDDTAQMEEMNIEW